MSEDWDGIESLHGADYLKKAHGEGWHTPQGRVIGEMVFGANDGSVNTI